MAHPGARRRPSPCDAARENGNPRKRRQPGSIDQAALAGRPPSRGRGPSRLTGCADRLTRAGMQDRQPPMPGRPLRRRHRGAVCPARAGSARARYREELGPDESTVLIGESYPLAESQGVVPLGEVVPGKRADRADLHDSPMRDHERSAVLR